MFIAIGGPNFGDSQIKGGTAANPSSIVNVDAIATTCKATNGRMFFLSR